MAVEACLPAELKGPSTTITRIAAGLSGAGVYRIEAAGQAFVLKIAGEAEDDADWHRAVQLQRLAADAGLTPRLVHVDPARRAVLTAFVADRSFLTFYLDPRTHDAAVTQLGRTVHRLHALPLPADAPMRDPRALLVQCRDDLLAGFAIPDFAGDAVQRVLAEDPPIGEGARVFGHNDLNPTNLVYDGEAILMLDWATAGPMDAFYDLGVLAIFLRMDEATCLRLLAAYEGTPRAGLPDRFCYHRRLAAALAGAFQLYLARQLQHPGATGAETADATASLGEFYQRMRAGELKLGTADGQWAFGLALLKNSLAL
jgi:thiamine kinase-like enzyme